MSHNWNLAFKSFNEVTAEASKNHIAVHEMWCPHFQVLVAAKLGQSVGHFSESSSAIC